MNRYKTDSGVELNLTPLQAKQYQKLSKLELIEEVVLADKKKPTNVREVSNQDND